MGPLVVLEDREAVRYQHAALRACRGPGSQRSDPPLPQQPGLLLGATDYVLIVEVIFSAGNALRYTVLR